MLDVHTNPANPIIGDRAFGTDARVAAAQALAFWRGLESAGVRGCGKHFPGHGDTATDSHLELPRVDADERRCAASSWCRSPRRREARVPMLMTAHVVYPAIDSEPATMSSAGSSTSCAASSAFDGVVVSDDLDMKAVHERWPTREVVRRSLSRRLRLLPRLPRCGGAAEAEAALDELVARDERRWRRASPSASRACAAFRATLRRSDATSDWRALPLADHEKLAARAR